MWTTRKPHYMCYCCFILCIIAFMVCEHASMAYGLSEIRIRAGKASNYTDSMNQVWLGDSYFNAGTMSCYSNITISNTADPELYVCERYNDSPELLKYSIPGFDPGVYQVDLHFAEVENSAFVPGARVFNVLIQNTRVLTNYDIFKQVGATTAEIQSFEASVEDDGLVTIALERVIQNPKVAAIHVSWLRPLPPVDIGLPKPPPLTSDGIKPTITAVNPTPAQPQSWITIYGEGFTEDSQVIFESTNAIQTKFINATSIMALAPTGYVGNVNLSVHLPSGVSSNKVEFVFQLPPDHTAHAVPGDPQTVSDVDGSGYATVTLDGFGSHTHAPAPSHLVSLEWYLRGTLLGRGVRITVSLPVGVNVVTLKVVDSAGNSHEDTVTITVISQLTKGIECYYYSFDNTLKEVPKTITKKPDWGKVETGSINFIPADGYFAGTNLKYYFAAVFRGYIDVDTPGNYGFALESDDGSILTINGDLIVNNDGLHGMTTVAGQANLKTGLNSFEIGYFNGGSDAGLRFYWTPPGGARTIVPATVFKYNLQRSLPVIHSLDPTTGSLSGGFKVTISGFGFVYPANRITVNFGTTPCMNVVVKNSYTIECVAPMVSQPASVMVTVTTPSGTSNGFKFNYCDHCDSVVFTGGILANVPAPTVVAFGPDERLYVGTVGGLVYRLTVDDNMNVIDTLVSHRLAGKALLGLGFNPKDFGDTNNVRVYVSHSILYQNGGNDARGGVAILYGPRLTDMIDLITGLPVSERDHGVNGIEFTQQLDMWINVGSNTNAGLPGPLTPSGTQTEKQLSGACLIARISKGDDFRGQVRYTNNDSENGQQIDGMDVRVYASGIKNSYAMVLHSNGKLYGTDNGPSIGYGRRSTSCTTDAEDPRTIDELNIIYEGAYYGHPNRARAKAMNDPRQCVYRGLSEPSIPGVYTAPIATLTSSCDGIIEYTANTFGGLMRGHLIISHFQGDLYEVVLSPDGNRVVSQSILVKQPMGGLSVVMAPDGSLISTDYYANNLNIVRPQTNPPNRLPYIISVFPVRGVMAGGNRISIRGFGFDANTQVTVNGVPCTNVTLVTYRKIQCIVPATQTKGLLASVTVTTGSGQSYTLTGAYKYTEV